MAVRSPHRMDALDRQNGQRDKRTNERTNGRTDGRTDGRTKRRVSSSVRPFVSNSIQETNRRPSLRLSLRWSLTLTASVALRYITQHCTCTRLWVAELRVLSDSDTRTSFDSRWRVNAVAKPPTPAAATRRCAITPLRPRRPITVHCMQIAHILSGIFHEQQIGQKYKLKCSMSQWLI